jgi:DNA-binding PadR family transcriptional regulator
MPKQTMKPHWFQILLAVADGPKHGTAIMEEVLERTDGAMKLWPGTLYGSLRELEVEGWLQETDPPEGAPTEGGKRRFYRITPEGSATLAEDVHRLASFVRVARAKRVIGEVEST